MVVRFQEAIDGGVRNRLPRLILFGSGARIKHAYLAHEFENLPVLKSVNERRS